MFFCTPFFEGIVSSMVTSADFWDCIILQYEKWSKILLLVPMSVHVSYILY